MSSHRWPQILPGGKGLLFAATAATRGSLRLRKPDGNTTIVVKDSSYGRYLPSGYLLFAQSGSLFAAPLDLNRGELTAPAVPLAQGVAYTPNVAYADFDVSASGTVVYVRGAASAGRVVSWMDSSGALSPLLAKTGEYTYPRLSPDGTRLAVLGNQDTDSNLWVYDSARDTMTKLTSNSRNLYPVWTPDGKYILFSTPTTLGWARSDGSATQDTGVTTGQGILNPWSMSPDGKRIAFTGTGGWTSTVEDGPNGLTVGTPRPFLQDSSHAMLSPDGRFVAYSSGQSGRGEIYVSSLTPERTVAPAGRTQVSNEGGDFPVWPADAHEIFFRGADRRIWVADYTVSGATFVPAKARAWSPRQLPDLGVIPAFDMDRGGKRAAVLMFPGGESPKPETHLRVLLNLNEELRRRAAAKP